MATGGANYSSIQERSSKSGVDNVLECRVCNDIFALQGDKVPRLLFCGHTVCHQCLTRLTPHGTAVLCPFDRQPTDMGDSGVWGLKKNFALLELLEKLQYPHRGIARVWSEEVLEREKQLAVPCDENESHMAVLFCTTCSTNLCLECSEVTHSTRTLARHKRVPLSEKPRENPKCLYHPIHLVEFVCLEDSCQNAPLMCYICKDYGRHVKHKHTLLDTEAESVRSTLNNARQHIHCFIEEIMDTARRLGTVIQQIEGGTHMTENSDGSTGLQQTIGTAEQARGRIRQYFHDLHETLARQEIAALTIVDTHIRERLCMLKQQQEDMGILLSQISAVYQQCDRTLQEDDTKVIIAKHEIGSLVETVKTQQQHFSELPEQLQLDPEIPITFTKDNRVHIGPKMEMRVVTLGLDDSGKTSILFKLKQNEFIPTIPTIGFNVETVEYKNLKFTIWDVGGQHKLRPLWKHYYFNTQALIYVIDSSTRDRLDEAYNELVKLLQEKELKEASLLVFANKQDIDPCLTIEEITEKFNLFKLCCGRSWHIQACDAKSGTGLHDGIEWLSRQLIAAGVNDHLLI